MRQRNQSDGVKRTAREVARVITNNVSVERKRTDLIVRPLRLAFIIREDLLQENLLRLLTYISSIWGGYFSCLIPSDGIKISDTDWNSLDFYEPDKVVFCSNEKESFSAELVNKIRNKNFPFAVLSIDDWDSSKDIFNLEMKHDSDPLISSIPLIVPMQYKLNELKQPIEEDKSQVRIPKVSQNHSLTLYIAAQVGMVSNFNKKAYLSGFKAKEIEFVTNKVKDYLTLLAEFENKFSPLNMTQLDIKMTVTIHGASERPEGLNIVFGGNNILLDLCKFWNLRLSHSFFEESALLFLPFDLFRSNKNLQELCDAIKLAPWSYPRINIHSGSVDKHKLRRFAKRFKEIMDTNAKIHLIENTILVSYFHTKHIQRTEEATIEENSFSFKCPKPKFADLMKGGDWAVDIKFDPPYEYPTFSQVNYLLCGSPTRRFYRGYWIHYAHKKFVHRANLHQAFVRGHFINGKQAYQEVFQDKGFSAKLTEKSAYTEGLLNLLQDPDILEDQSIRDFFWRLQKQDAYTYAQLCFELKKGIASGDLIDSFVTKRILIRGMEFRCGACGLLRFYPINTLDEEMQCPGCLKLLQPPSRTPIMFRLNELASRAVEQGSIPVILTHKFLEKISPNRTLHVFDIEIMKDNFNMEVDYVTTHQDDLVLVECKDFKSGVLPKAKKDAIQKIVALVRLAKQVDASSVILSTLLPYPSSDYTDFALQIKKIKTKSKFPVRLLSLSRNGFVNLDDPEKLVEYPFIFD